MIEQYKCPSWADDDGVIQDCECGKCVVTHPRLGDE